MHGRSRDRSASACAAPARAAGHEGPAEHSRKRDPTRGNPGRDRPELECAELSLLECIGSSLPPSSTIAGPGGEDPLVSVPEAPGVAPPRAITVESRARSPSGHATPTHPHVRTDNHGWICATP